MSRALAVLAPEKVTLQEREAPIPRDGEIVVRPVAIGLCGTDLEIVDGRIDPAYVRYPVVIGHEWTGTVARDPERKLAVGTRVVVEGIVPCGVCTFCRARKTNLCLNYDELGFTRDGAAADLAVVPAGLVHTIEASVPTDDAALAEPCAVVYRGLRRADPTEGERCLVVGDGTIALLAVHLLGMFAPSEVVMLGLRPEQEGLALRLGATRFESDVSRTGRDYDLVVEAAGATAAAVTAIEAAGRGGTVVLLGLPPHGERAAIAVDDLVNADLSVLGSFGYTSTAWREVVELLNAGRIHPSGVITHRFELDDWEQALATLRHADGPRGKVLLEIGDRPA